MDRSNPLSRLFLIIVGTISLALGVLGVILPLLPATPFLLLAAACYVRSSDRLYNWLLNNRLVGNYIRNMRDKKGMPLRAKIISIALLWLSLIFSMYRINQTSITLVLIATGIGVTYLISRIPTLRQLQDSPK